MPTTTDTHVPDNRAAIRSSATPTGRIAILTADRVEDVEFFYPYYRFTEAGYDVDVLTPSGAELTGYRGLALRTGLQPVSDAHAADYDALSLRVADEEVEALHGHAHQGERRVGTGVGFNSCNWCAVYEHGYLGASVVITLLLLMSGRTIEWTAGDHSSRAVTAAKTHKPCPPPSDDRHTTTAPNPPEQ